MNCPTICNGRTYDPTRPAQANANPITEDDIAHYLLNSPDFFARHAEVLAGVQFVSPHSKRTVSLQERQAGLLRDKIKVLELRIMELLRRMDRAWRNAPARSSA